MVDEWRWCATAARAPRVRTMRDFAEQEIVIPDGPDAGRRYRCHRAPYARLWFAEVDSARWSRFVATGPTQTGKTLSCCVIPVCYHLFELNETVIFGLPDMDMAADKWREDLLPVIGRSRYRDLLPVRGGGSRGGKVESIKFLNGATLKFMSGGGSDKSRAGFTARVVVITETDGLDEAGAASREADKITQLEARTRRYGWRKRIYMECTVSIEDGRTWREYTAGTRSQIVLRCPLCQSTVMPEREHLLGWQDAKTLVDARTLAHFFCPECGEAWSETDRQAANQSAVLLHKGQRLDADGAVTGEAPKTDTLGFRWSAVHNLFVSAGEVGADEWRAGRSASPDNAEKEMRQFVWALPHQPEKWESTPVTAHALIRRTGQTRKGIVPAGAQYLTIGVDLGKWLCHWTAIAWSADASGRVVDYGRFEVPSEQYGVERALTIALHGFRDMILAGWPDETGKPRVADQVWIDSGNWSDTVYAFCREPKSSSRFRPAMGAGVGQTGKLSYTRPKSTGAVVVYIGEEYHIARLKKKRVHLVEINADYWKSWIHERLVCSADEAGAITLHAAEPRDHLAIAKHLTSERQVEEFIAARGMVKRWETVHQNNHWLDAIYRTAAAGHLAGVRLVPDEVAAPRSRAPARPQLTTPDGRPFLVTER